MRFWAIVVLCIFFLVVILLYKIAHSTIDAIVVTIIVIGLFMFVRKRMPWVLYSLSNKYDIESQRCIGLNITKEDCFGVVSDRY